MGIIQDMINILQDFSNVGDDILEDTVKKRRYSSISRRSMEGTLQFPTLVSRSIDIDTLQMITKALERQFASFTQVALTMSPFLSMTKDKDAVGYVRKFHQNMNRGNVRDDFLNMLGNMSNPVAEAYSVYQSEDSDIVMFIAVGEGTTPKVLKTNREGLDIMMEGLRETCLNDMYRPAQSFRTSNSYLRDKHSTVFENTVTNDNKGSDLSTEIKGGFRVDQQTINYNIKGGAKGGSMPGQMSQQLPNKVLQDNDVKKSNELVPSTMHIRTSLVDGTGNFAGNMDFIIGVKATMHPITSDEIVENVTDGIKNRGKLFKAIRWTTGEIQFARDYLFNLTEIREDAVKTTSKTSRWWTALKRRRKLSNLRKAIFLPGELLPNASIVLSIEEVDFIKREHGFDLLDPRTAYKLMNEYFLISFTVVDVGGQMAHFLFDGNEDYQTVTFSGLERGDLNGGGVDFKDVLKLVQRV